MDKAERPGTKARVEYAGELLQALRERRLGGPAAALDLGHARFPQQPSRLASIGARMERGAESGRIDRACEHWSKFYREAL